MNGNSVLFRTQITGLEGKQAGWTERESQANLEMLKRSLDSLQAGRQRLQTRLRFLSVDRQRKLVLVKN